MSDVPILVVDDEQSMREFLEIFLRREGFEVATAGDVEAAVLAIDGDDFDLVITDINMPIMDGLKLVKHIRKNEVHKDVPVIVITTEGSSEDRARAMALGASAYITKPIQAPQVIAQVKELLGIT